MFKRILIIVLWAIIIGFSIKYTIDKNEEKGISVIIKKGDDVVKVSYILKEKGVIDDRNTFILLSGITGIDKRIKPGRYIFSKNMRELEVLRILEKGSKYIKVTIPEGSNMYEIAGIVQDKLGIDSLLFLSTVNQPEFLRKWHIKGGICEGYLFPETYYFSYGESAANVGDVMLQEFYKVWDSLWSLIDTPPPVDSYSVLIMASLVEAETNYDPEKPLIAGVYYNRLRKGWKLQCDPTVLYSIGEKRKVYYKDLKIDSPYNTYKHRGLPPTPICSPGRTSIYAALKPDKTDYMYFVANKGKHIFAKTLKEHNRNIKEIKWKR